MTTFTAYNINPNNAPQEKERVVLNSDMRDQLERFYNEEDRRLKRHKKMNKIILFTIILTLIIIGTVLFALNIIFNNVNNQFTGHGIGMSIDGPLKTTSNTEIEYNIEISNNDSVPIKNLNLTVSYPEGFVFIKSNHNHKLNKNNSWTFSNLPTEKKEIIKISGLISGDINTEKPIQVILTYEPINFYSSFRKEAKMSTTIIGGNLELNLSGPEQVLLNTKATYTLGYTNLTNTIFKDILLSINHSNDFIIQSIEPNTSYVDSIYYTKWKIPTLNPGESKNITLTGIFVNATSTSLEAKLEAKGNDEIYHVQKQITLPINIVEAKLKLSLILNGSNDNKTPINLDDVLNYTIIYQNQDNVSLEDINITANIDSQLIDWSSFQSAFQAQIDNDNNQIIFTKNEIPNLASLAPQASGIIDFRIKTKSQAVSQIKNSTIKSSAQAKINQIQGKQFDTTISSNILINTLNTDVSLQYQSRYFDDNKIAVGAGPIPPQVGSTTTYKLNVRAKTIIHDIQDVVISTNLPSNVIWNDKYNISTGTLIYDPNTKTINWSINKLPTGIDINADFEVTITPTPEEINKILILSNGVNFSGVDSVTSNQIQKNTTPVTTMLDSDPVMKGRGVVIGTLIPQ